MNSSLLIIFGKPGAGKSYVAEILRETFGYTIHDGDDDIPDDMKKALFNKAEITDDMRNRFLANMIASIRTLSRQHDTLAVHQTFLKEYMRKSVLETFPHAKFILVETDDVIREKRYMERKSFNLGLPYLRRMTHLFDPVQIPHTVIQNTRNGQQTCLLQLQQSGLT